jgi:putative chitinase
MNTTSLKGIVPTIVLTQLPDVMSRFGIDDILKLAHFISQCDYESEQFSAVRENLNYSAQALLKVFPTHFDAAAAQSYARQPEKIANRAYANRMGNGDEASGDGWNYRGRGYIQLTGKVNYQALTHFLNDPNIDLITNPDLVATVYPLSSPPSSFTQTTSSPSATAAQRQT